jgi:hypothetical protein
MRGRPSHHAAPSESALELLARVGMPPLELGVPLLAGRVRAGDTVEVAGTAQWIVSELASHMAARLIAASAGEEGAGTRGARVTVLDVQRAHDFGRTAQLARETMAQRGLAETSQQRALEEARAVRCGSALQLLCALRQCQEQQHSDVRRVVLVDGLSNLFWAHKQTSRVPGRAPDVLAACVRVMRQLAQRGATVIATKLVLFPRKGVFDDYFGGGWKVGLKAAIAVEDTKMTVAALGRTGARAQGVVYDSGAPDRTHAFQVTTTGCHFKPQQ